MLTLAAFASLAQLGSGLALALTIFVEPISLRERRYRQKLEGALYLIPKDGSDSSQVRANDIWTKTAELNAAAKRAEAQSRRPLWLIKIGAALNFIILLFATIAPDGEVNDAWMWALLALCILPVSMGTMWLSMLARIRIGSLERDSKVGLNLLGKCSCDGGSSATPRRSLRNGLVAFRAFGPKVQGPVSGFDDPQHSRVLDPTIRRTVARPGIMKGHSAASRLRGKAMSTLPPPPSPRPTRPGASQDRREEEAGGEHGEGKPAGGAAGEEAASADGQWP